MIDEQLYDTAVEECIALKERVQELRYAIFDKRYDGTERLAPIHFEWWGKSIREKQGYENSELTSLLDRSAALGGE